MATSTHSPVHQQHMLQPLSHGHKQTLQDSWGPSVVAASQSPGCPLPAATHPLEQPWLCAHMRCLLSDLFLHLKISQCQQCLSFHSRTSKQGSCPRRRMPPAPAKGLQLPHAAVPDSRLASILAAGRDRAPSWRNLGKPRTPYCCEQPLAMAMATGTAPRGAQGEWHGAASTGTTKEGKEQGEAGAAGIYCKRSGNGDCSAPAQLL